MGAGDWQQHVAAQGEDKDQVGSLAVWTAGKETGEDKSYPEVTPSTPPLSADAKEKELRAQPQVEDYGSPGDEKAKLAFPGEQKGRYSGPTIHHIFRHIQREHTRVRRGRRHRGLPGRLQNRDSQVSPRIGGATAEAPDGPGHVATEPVVC